MPVLRAAKYASASVMILLRKSLLRVVRVLHDLILAHLMTHVRVTLHIVVDLVRPLCNYIQGGGPGGNRVSI